MKSRTITSLVLAAALLAAAAPGQPARNGRASAMEPNKKMATFAGGCFWCMEPPFDQVEGILYRFSCGRDQRLKEIWGGR